MRELSSRSPGRPNNGLAPSENGSGSFAGPLAELSLFGRPGCHLCADMRAALEEFRDELGFSLREVDIDADPDLAARYGALIPVLVVDGLEICRYHLDPAALRRALESAGETG